MLPPPRVGGGQVDFIEHRADLQVVVQGQIGIGQRLGLRNFSIIAHIDHGKSTLSDRMIELCGAVEQRQMESPTS